MELTVSRAPVAGQQGRKQSTVAGTSEKKICILITVKKHLNKWIGAG